MRIKIVTYESLWKLYEQERDIASQRTIGCVCSTKMYAEILFGWYRHADAAMVVFTGDPSYNGTSFEEFDAARKIWRKMTGDKNGYA